jgi:hypothetical protein
VYFASVDPERSTRTTTHVGAREVCGEAVARRSPGAWQRPLVACRLRFVAARAPGLRSARDYEPIAHAGAVLAVVEQALIGRVGDRDAAGSPCEPRGSLCCAAQALDATALLWHRLRPAAARRSARACAITSAKRASLPRAQPSPRQHPAPPARRQSSSQVARARVTPDSRDLGVRRWRSVARAYACRPGAVALRSLVRSAVLNRALALRRRAAGLAGVAAGIVCSAPPR